MSAKKVQLIIAEPTSFDFHGARVRVIADANGQALFVGKDICDALGYARSSDAMQAHCKGAAIYRPLQTAGGLQEVRVLSEGDMFRLVVNSTLPTAEAFERMVFDEILPTIRRTGSYTAKAAKPQKDPTATDALRLMPIALRAARALGLDKNAAAVSANQAVIKITGTNVMQLLGHVHLDAEKQAVLHTPTELGAIAGGLSARSINTILAQAGMQHKVGDSWVPLPAAEGYCRVLDTGKRHGSGVMIQQIKWTEDVLSKIGLLPIGGEAA